MAFDYTVFLSIISDPNMKDIQILKAINKEEWVRNQTTLFSMRDYLGLNRFAVE